VLAGLGSSQLQRIVTVANNVSNKPVLINLDVFIERE
jgi:hypothetical protein